MWEIDIHGMSMITAINKRTKYLKDQECHYDYSFIVLPILKPSLGKRNIWEIDVNQYTINIIVQKSHLLVLCAFNDS